MIQEMIIQNHAPNFWSLILQFTQVQAGSLNYIFSSFSSEIIHSFSTRRAKRRLLPVVTASQHRHKMNNYIEIIGVTSGISLLYFPVVTVICTTGSINIFVQILISEFQFTTT